MSSSKLTAAEEDGVPFGVPASHDDERDEVIEQIVETVHRVFDAFANSEPSVFDSLVDEDARFVRTAYDEDGSPEYVSYSKDYFLSTLTSVKKGELEEQIFEPFVQRRDTMAHVWCRYVLNKTTTIHRNDRVASRYAMKVGGEPRYAGVKSIQLRAAAEGQWRIVNVCDTVD
mmetsp:Transcript_62203/g.166914  ORF Transcript_62203/g.166914 Transcript_62203/m.166914 type:complete len:172 (+) Transcript_62203:11-526(+)